VPDLTRLLRAAREAEDRQADAQHSERRRLGNHQRALDARVVEADVLEIAAAVGLETEAQGADRDRDRVGVPHERETERGPVHVAAQVGIRRGDRQERVEQREAAANCIHCVESHDVRGLVAVSDRCVRGQQDRDRDARVAAEAHVVELHASRRHAAREGLVEIPARLEVGAFVPGENAGEGVGTVLWRAQ
jgi:hypothetical protein